MKRLLALAVLAAATPALAVGLGPLRKEGVTDGPDKAFYLTLYNPYKTRENFVVHAVGAEDEIPAPRVRLPSMLPLRPESARKIMIVVGGLIPGESYTFRLCAEKFTPEQETIHARVCSRLTARRLSGSGA